MTPYERLNQLRVDETAGRPVDVLPFWGHRGPGSACLSQWYPAGFTVDGVTYPTAEHWMMAGKARLFDDAAGLAAVLAAPGPAEAKSAGRRVRGFDEESWKGARYDLVVTGNLPSSASTGTCAVSCSEPATGCSSRPARTTGSGAWVWARTTPTCTGPRPGAG